MTSLLAFLFAAALAADAKKPDAPKPMVSVSYEAIVRCYPDLKDSAMSYRVDLGKLREKIDSIYATDRTQLKSRVVKFKDAAGGHRLQLETKKDPKKPLSLPYVEARWENINEKGESSVWEAPELKTRPTVLEINQVLARGAIESDERVDVDTKLKGRILQVRRSLSKVVELRFEDAPNKITLNCESRPEEGSVCICLKK